MGSLGAVPTLLDLQINHNKIRRISSAAFTRLASLRQLEVTHNNLKSVFQVGNKFYLQLIYCSPRPRMNKKRGASFLWFNRFHQV